MTCRTCVHLDVLPNKDGKIIPRRGQAYVCLFAEGFEMPPLPDSITQAYGFKWPPRSTRVEPMDGENCPTYSPRPTQKETGE